MTLKKRLQKVEANRAQFTRWIPPIVEYDQADPGAAERATAQAEAQARAAGWKPADGPFVVLIGLPGGAE